jgi:hypothetical protein
MGHVSGSVELAEGYAPRTLDHPDISLPGTGSVPIAGDPLGTAALISLF